MSKPAPWQKPTMSRPHRPEVQIEQLPDGRTRHIYPLTAMGKPRATQRDKWNPSKAVQRYRLFADLVRLYGIDVPDAGYHITFVLPMPKSWTKTKKAAHDGGPHQQKPDKDNLEKALLDAARKGHEKDDCTIWDGRVSKLWGTEGKIIIDYGVQ